MESRQVLNPQVLNPQVLPTQNGSWRSDSERSRTPASHNPEREFRDSPTLELSEPTHGILSNELTRAPL